MTALSSLLFPCFQAFSAVSSRPIPPSRPPFVTNLLRQPVSDLFQFYAAFSLPSRLISFSDIFSLPYCLIPFFAAFSHLSRLISFSVTFSLPYCLIPFFAAFSPLSRLIPFFAAFSPLSRLILDFFLLLSVHLQYSQCIFSCSIILSVSPAYTKSIYFIIICYFECRFGSNLYSPSTVKYLFFYLPLDSVNRFM